MPPVELHRLAIAEARRARRYHSRHSPPGVAARFAVALENALTRVAIHPTACPTYLHGTRFCPVKKFSHFLVYRIEPTRVFVFAVAHIRQRPGYWSRRLPGP